MSAQVYGFEGIAKREQATIGSGASKYKLYVPEVTLMTTAQEMAQTRAIHR